jgi:hypothetical protein
MSCVRRLAKPHGNLFVREHIPLYGWTLHVCYHFLIIYLSISCRLAIAFSPRSAHVGSLTHGVTLPEVKK